jgi:hypothetical protein
MAFNRQSASGDGLCVNLKVPSCRASDQCRKHLRHGVYILILCLRHRQAMRLFALPLRRPSELPNPVSSLSSIFKTRLYKYSFLQFKIVFCTDYNSVLLGYSAAGNNAERLAVQGGNRQARLASKQLARELNADAVASVSSPATDKPLLRLPVIVYSTGRKKRSHPH